MGIQGFRFPPVNQARRDGEKSTAGGTTLWLHVLALKLRAYLPQASRITLRFGLEILPMYRVTDYHRCMTEYLRESRPIGSSNSSIISVFTREERSAPVIVSILSLRIPSYSKPEIDIRLRSAMNRKIHYTSPI